MHSYVYIEHIIQIFFQALFYLLIVWGKCSGGEEEESVEYQHQAPGFSRFGME